MKVYLSYCSSQSIEYCFWEYFFKSIGVYVESTRIFEDKPKEIDLSKNPQLILLDMDYKHLIKNKNKGIVYCLKTASSIIIDDITIPNSQDYKKSILENLFKHFNSQSELEILTELLDIFHNDRNSLWGASWLINATNYDIINKLGKKEVLNILEHSFNSLNILKLKYNYNYKYKYNYNYIYMLFYCKYLIFKLQQRSDFQVILNQMKNSNLNVLTLSNCQQAMLHTLQGNLYEFLTTYENQKQAVYYYEQALKYVESTELLYRIGIIYETYLEDKAMALKAYTKLGSLDKNDCKLNYRVALLARRKNKELAALGCFENVVVYYDENSMSIQEFEVFYKSICYIMRNNLFIIDEDYYRKLRNDVKENLEEYLNFTPLMTAMFGETDGKEKSKLIQNEIRDFINKI